MTCLHGETVFGGVALGEAFVFRRSTGENDVKYEKLGASEEIKRLELAVCAVKEKLTLCEEQAEVEAEKQIFEVHRMMLEDEISDFLFETADNGVSALDAVSLAENHFSEIFKETEDEYLIARIPDIREICGSIKAYLTNEKTSEKPQKPVILVAEELFPGDLIEMGKEKIIGIVMSSGTVFSHISVLIKELRIPAVICKNIDDIKDSMPVLLDGENGILYLEPDERTAERVKSASGSKKKTFSLNALPFELYVNIGNPCELDDGLLKKCNGIGLFRTEYLYVGRKTLPSEEEQFSVYRKILEKANGKPVTVRTFDIGSDKSTEALPIKREENPALGFRGLRVYYLYPEVLKTQLRALLRSAVYGNLRIMYPMVNSREEIAFINNILSQVQEELREQSVPYTMPVQGAMIETPAAAVLSDDIAKAVDFFSVGTNDLAQYTLALDRQNGNLSRFCDSSFRAVLSLIGLATENAHKNGIKIGICGELASVPAFLPEWEKIGIDYISVSPGVL